MNAGFCRYVIGLALLLSTTACSFAPLSPRVDAASLSKGEFRIQSNVSPTASLGAIYGASDNVDLGLEIEQSVMSSAWARYSFKNNPYGFSLAGNAGVFQSKGETLSNGWYLGILASHQISPKVRWTAGYRYAQLDYQYGNPDHFDTWLEFDNPDDGSVNGQAQLSVSFLMKPHLEMTLGTVCQQNLNNSGDSFNDSLCLPVLGFAFYRL